MLKWFEQAADLITQGAKYLIWIDELLALPEEQRLLELQTKVEDMDSEAFLVFDTALRTRISLLKGSIERATRSDTMESFEDKERCLSALESLSENAKKFRTVDSLGSDRTPTQSRWQCDNCRYQRWYVWPELLSKSELGTPGGMEVNNKILNEKREQRLLEKALLQAGEPFQHEPRFYPWCSKYSIRGNYRNADSYLPCEYLNYDENCDGYEAK